MGENTNMMSKNNSVVAIYKSHIEAEIAVKELQQAGFDMKKLSKDIWNFKRKWPVSGKETRPTEIRSMSFGKRRKIIGKS